MAQSTSASEYSTCKGLKSDGTLCRRRVSPGQRVCYQHAVGLRAKWRALPTNKRAVFWIGIVVGVVSIVMTTLAWVYPDVWKRTRPNAAAQAIHPSSDARGPLEPNASQKSAIDLSNLSLPTARKGPGQGATEGLHAKPLLNFRKSSQTLASPSTLSSSKIAKPVQPEGKAESTALEVTPDGAVPSANVTDVQSGAARRPTAESPINLDEKVGLAVATQTDQKIEPPAASTLTSGPATHARSQTRNDILEEIKGALQKDRESGELRGCQAGKSVVLRAIGDDISYYVCVQQCFAVWKTVSRKNLDFDSVKITQPFQDPTMALVEIPCAKRELCTKDSQGTFPASTGCVKKKVKEDFLPTFDMVVHVENADAIRTLWKAFAAAGP